MPKRANDVQASPKGGSEVCCEGGARPAPSGKGRSSYRPDPRCANLYLGKREGRRRRCPERRINARQN